MTFFCVKECVARRSEVCFRVSDSCSTVGRLFWGETTAMSAKAKDNSRTKTGYYKKRVHSSLTSPVQPSVSVYCMHFSVKETDLTALYTCFVESRRGCFLLRAYGTYQKGCIMYEKALS